MMNEFHGKFGIHHAGPAPAQVAGNGVPRTLRAHIRKGNGDMRPRNAVDVTRGEYRFLVVGDLRHGMDGLLVVSHEPKSFQLCQAKRNVITCLLQSAIPLLGNASRDPPWRFTSRNTKPDGTEYVVTLI